MEKKYLLGVDLGTSACKAAIFDRSGNVMGSSASEYPVYYPKSGWAEQDPNDWWKAVCMAIKGSFENGKIEPDEIAGIGIDGQSWSAVAVDGDGAVLTNTPIWMDTRAHDICIRLNEEIGVENIFSLTGNSLQPSYTTAKVIWYKENLPQIFEKTDKILQSNGFIVFRLTGNATQDVSQGYGWHCFDMKTGTWNLDMCKKLGIPERFLPRIAACDEIVGYVTEKAAQQTGLKIGTPVIAGGLDAACGTLGAGVIDPGETQEQGGQAGGMSICLDTYKADPRLILSYHVVPNRWLLQGGTVGGGGVIRWFEKEFAEYERSISEKTGTSSLQQLNEQGSLIPAGSDGVVFLPYMAGERSPIWNPDAKGVFFGLDYSKTKGHMLRACMEGAAFSLRHNLDTAEEAGAHAEVLRAMGGAANSRLWTQIKADITGKTIIVPSSDTATTLGVAMLAGVAVGIYKDYAEAVGFTVSERARYTPNVKNKKVYDRNYQTYLKLYTVLKPLMNNSDLEGIS